MSFAPIRTDRLLLRLPRRSDAAALAERRSDPRVAEFQNWIPPYPLARAEALITGLVESAWLADGEWSMLTIADPADTRILGDLALHPTWDGRSIEIGYSLAPAAWGRGLALEAVNALVDHLWADPGVTRLSAMLHPDNVPSEQVLERTGFRFEGRTRLSYWVGDDNSDDLLYGMTRADRIAWAERPRQHPMDVELIEIDAGNLHAITSLTTHRSQERFVPPVAIALAEALGSARGDGGSTVARSLGITADDELVGFAALALLAEGPGNGSPGNGSPGLELTRFLIDRRHQRRGVGMMALDAVIAECRHAGASSLTTRWRRGRGSPGPFWEQAGFVPTNATADDEIEATLVFDAS